MTGAPSVTVPLSRDLHGAAERMVLRSGAFEAVAFRYPTGVEAMRLSNARGHATALPWMGGMLWDATMDGVRLGMTGHFDAPRPASGILGTYGCLLFHAGLLRMGVPGPGDDHALHGEFPCAPMDAARLEVGAGEDGAPVLRLVSTRDRAEGFGPRYVAEAFVALRAGSGEFEAGVEVRNPSGRACDLMYMAHANFAFVPGGRVVQPAPFDAAHVAVRRAVPSHVAPSAEYLARLDALARDPAALEVLDPALCDPEQVFYLGGLGTDAEGVSHQMLLRPEGDAFALSHRPAELPVCVRWLLHGPDERVAGFSLPATAGPEGYTAERAKGTVRSLAPGASARFSVRLGYLSAEEARARAALIAGTTAR